MATSITTKPQYPVAEKQITVGFGAASGNFVKVYFTDAPVGSKERDDLIKQNASRILVTSVDAGGVWNFTPEMPGIYTLTLEEYQKGATTWGGGYQGSPSGYQSETLLTTTAGVQLIVGQKITQRIGLGNDTATLTLFIHGGFIRRSLDDTHGFASPLIDEAKSPKATTASLNSGVLTAVAGLIDASVATAIGTLSTVVDDMITKYSAHIAVTPAVHAAADADNTIPAAFKNPNAPVGLKESMTLLLRKLGLHMRNDDGSGAVTPGTGSKGYHVVSGNNRADWLNALLVTGAGEALDTFVAIADWWRAYEAHRVNAAVHVGADATNVLNALPAILNIHRLFLAELQKQNPTTPASVDSGITALIHQAGFET